MPLVLNELHPPVFSDGTPDFYPTVYKSPRAPAGGYVECDPSRVQKYLDKLSIALKDAYIQSPEKIPGVDMAEVIRHGGVAFKNNVFLRRFPDHYRMFESRKPEHMPGSTPSTPAASSAPSPAVGSSTGANGGTTIDVESEGSLAAAAKTEAVSTEEDPSKSRLPKSEKFRADAFIFGHPSGSKYRSTNEFTPHLLWLVNDDSHDHRNCPCKLCSNFLKSGGKCFPKGKGTSLGPVTPSTSLKSRSQSVKHDIEPSPLTIASVSRTASPLVLPEAKKQTPRIDDVWEMDYKSSARTSPNPASRDGTDSDDEGASIKARKTKHKRSKESGVYSDAKYKKKYRELKRKIHEIEEENSKMIEEYDVTKKRLSRLRFERGLLYERLQFVHQGSIPKEPLSKESSPPSSPSSDTEQEPIPPPSTIKKPVKRKEKKPIDPNAPRRPANAFMLFCDLSREQLKKEREGLEEAEIEEKGLTNLTKALGARWKGLGEEEKGRWRALFLEQVQRYDREMLEYQGGGSGRDDTTLGVDRMGVGVPSSPALVPNEGAREGEDEVLDEEPLGSELESAAEKEDLMEGVEVVS
ncbi:hypothetical protein, variant [Spizellomyces punctatus DAOM BR117]|uniref:HMG box domain-containing protein n=1 Tax=Spizellomyces punctatus (strain DAOM BR117) TaxID=645134 RepID=A0A0L0HQS0_SPIPD|nr:hypothetical protein, variant [Spizellomyces punctatus DAOM BR117]KND03731.1 hypothetical protein, variant [Spizellomyces punctatus DAOM BR117]|eukprot:XP_016611770.1 hypothetical protein, variant [Spizellomyces punctatus DAOM BR117]